MRVLIVDDEPGVTESVTEFVRGEGHEVRTAATAAAALKTALEFGPHLILLDQGLPDQLGSHVLGRLREVAPAAGVVMFTGNADVQGAVEAMRLGAQDYLPKPFNLDQLRLLLQRQDETQRLRAQLEGLRRFQWERYQKEYLLLPDQKMDRIYQQIEQVADLERVTVLVQGETGTGKEHVARLIHFLSKRATGPFVEIHCGAVPEAILESELFGIEAGPSAAGAKSKPGLFETATGGTLFLDEIGEMPLPIQAKLLKVLEERRSRRLGGTREMTLDVRLVASTNRDLKAEVAAGHFRRDLYFRLNGFLINLPPLRERLQDIHVLSQHFLAEACKEFGVPAAQPPQDFIQRLETHTWPGNVRELKNLMDRLVIMRRGTQPDWSALDELLEKVTPVPASSMAAMSVAELGTMEDVEWRAIEQALMLCKGNRTLASKRLGISRKTLFNKMRLKNAAAKQEAGLGQSAEAPQA
jgi:two-component system response regulator AtoC